MLVDSSEAWTPVPAVGRPLQADWSPLSLVKAYRVRPSASTRMSPSSLLATATVVPLAAWAAVVVGAWVAADPDPPSSPPPQAATATVSAASSAARANAFLMTRPPWTVVGPTAGARSAPRWTTHGPGRWFPTQALVRHLGDRERPIRTGRRRDPVRRSSGPGESGSRHRTSRGPGSGPPARGSSRRR